MSDEPALVRRTRRILPAVAAAAADADARRRLPDHIVAAVTEAGFARHFVPSRWGGHEGRLADLCGAVMLLAEHCPSTAWAASLAAILGRIAGYLPEEGRRRVWSGSPDTLVVGSLLPLGTATAVRGGWMVDGRWPYISSVEFSDWALVLAAVGDGAHTRFFAVPRSAYAIERTWNNLGMRATGSHTLTLEPTFVAEECSFDRAALDLGGPAGMGPDTTPDTTPDVTAGVAPGAAGHRVPLEAWAGLAFAPTVVGAARGLLRSWRDAVRGKVAAGAQGRTPVPPHTFELAVTRSAGEIDAAALLVERAAARADGGDLNGLEVAAGARDCALASELARTAADRLMDTAGTAALAVDRPLQRFWRDVHSGSSHVMLQLSRAAAGYARLAFAEEER